MISGGRNIKVQDHSLELRLLIAGWLVAAGLSWLGFAQALQKQDFITLVLLKPAPIYFILRGLTWGVIETSTTFGLLLRWRWAPWLARLGALLLAGWYWVERLWLYRSPSIQKNLPFAAGFTILILASVFVILSLPAQRRFFSRRNS